MRLKFRILLLLSAILIVSCSEYSKEEAKVITMLYKEVPKVIKLPPIESLSDSIIKETDFSNRKPITHKYSINKNYMRFESQKIFSKIFKKQGSDKIFADRISIDSVDFALAKKTMSPNQIKSILKNNDLNEMLGESVIFTDKLEPNTKENKQNRVYNRLLSFTPISFNNTYDKAAIGVANYGGKLDSSLIIYVMEKIDGKWQIKCYKVIEYS